MYKIISRYEFRDAFKRCGRNNQFSYEALNALYDYYEEIEPHNNGLGIQLDVIALCCEWTQYSSIKDYNEAYETEYDNYKALADAGYCSVIHIDGAEFLTDEH